MSTLRVCLLLITASATAWGGWRHDCRVATHDLRKECRQTKGDSLHPRPPGDCRLVCGPATCEPGALPAYKGFISENCSRTPDGCVTTPDGTVLCPPLATMAVCSFPLSFPPPSSPSGAF